MSIFSISFNSGCGYCFVTREPRGYYLDCVEEGRLGGPRPTIAGALNSDGMQYGGPYIIETNVAPEELREILCQCDFVDLPGACLTINGKDIPTNGIDAIVAAYHSKPVPSGNKSWPEVHGKQIVERDPPRKLIDPQLEAEKQRKQQRRQDLIADMKAHHPHMSEEQIIRDLEAWGE
jgi:hypothetical protein